MSFKEFSEKHEVSSTLKSLGIVFGDIGTSPIYTMSVIFILLAPTADNIYGITSLILWTLILIVTVEYVWLAMSLSKRGEGGTIVLLEILIPLLKSGRTIGLFTFFAYLGVCLLIGDGIITPAISILSAVEGINLMPSLENVKNIHLVYLAAIIAIVLFAFQKKGTEKVGKTFAPIMLIWFIALFISGLISCFNEPAIIKTLSPYYGIKFLWEHGFIGFFTLSEVILCATGGEALYADMGQLKRKPITQAWVLVFISLIVNYLGQSVYLLKNPVSDGHSILYLMVNSQTKYLYLPFLILSIFATVIASQAMITGIFSVVYQAVNMRLLPLLKISYTSDKIKEQIYIGSVNWFLLIAIIIILFWFQTSDALAAAYGLAVTGAMVFVGFIMIMIFHKQKKRLKQSVCICTTTIIACYFVSTLFKIPYGGYWSLILAAIPLSIIIIFTRGQKKLFKTLRPLDKDIFLMAYNEAYEKFSKIKGSAIFFLRDIDFIPPYVAHTMFKNEIIYEDNIFVSIIRKNGPWGIHSFFRDDIAKGLRVFEIRLGYMEREPVISLIRKAGIKEKVIFYGQEEIVTDKIIWKIFALIKRNTSTYVQFYKLPPVELHGVVTRIELK